MYGVSVKEFTAIQQRLIAWATGLRDAPHHRT